MNVDRHYHYKFMDASVQFLMSFLTYIQSGATEVSVVVLWVVTREVEVCVLSRARGVCDVMR